MIAVPKLAVEYRHPSLPPRDKIALAKMKHRMARAALDDAVALFLFQQENNRLGRASMLRGLGALNSRKNPKQAACCFYEAAQLYEMEEHDAALREADKH